MMEDPRNITACTHLLFVAKNIERIGDHATNIAENIHYLVIGHPLTSERPKGDESSFTVVTPHAGTAGLTAKPWNDEPMNSALKPLVLIVEDEAAL